MLIFYFLATWNYFSLQVFCAQHTTVSTALVLSSKKRIK